MNQSGIRYLEVVDFSLQQALHRGEPTQEEIDELLLAKAVLEDLLGGSKYPAGDPDPDELEMSANP